MFFSTDPVAHENKIRSLARQLHDQSDQTWKLHTPQRYGRFLLEQAAHRRAILLSLRDRIKDAPNPEVALAEAQKEEQGIALQFGLGRDLIDGLTPLVSPAPARAEAIVRLYEEASGKKL